MLVEQPRELHAAAADDCSTLARMPLARLLYHILIERPAAFRLYANFTNFSETEFIQ